jgi:glyoxylase-like metal-dependent hydrolase (beta-lactamase superfamily II)
VTPLHTKKIGKNLYQVELSTGGFKQLICSYVIAGKRPMLIESGPTNSVPNLLSGIDELGIGRESIEHVALTHIHLDHGGGAGTLLKSLPNAKVIVHPRGAPHIIDPERLWNSSLSVLGFVSEIFGKPERIPKHRVVSITEGIIDLGEGEKLAINETSGHATHHLSFQESFKGGIFVGDAAGTYLAEYGVVVPTIPPPFFLENALVSLDKIIALKPTSLYFSHFGEAEDPINRLKSYKEQLKLWIKVAEEGVRVNLSIEQIRDNIIAQDQALSSVIDYVKSHKILQRTVLDNCVSGAVRYVEHQLGKVES